MKKDLKYRPAVFVVVYKKDNKGDNVLYLLLKRKLHWTGWEFPKGGIEKNEKESDCVKREIKEETSLKAKKIIYHNVHGKYKYGPLAKKNRPGYKGQSYSLYSAEVNGGKVKIDKKEHSAYKWCEFNYALKLLKWNNQKKCLKMINNYLL